MDRSWFFAEPPKLFKVISVGGVKVEYHNVFVPGFLDLRW